MKRTLMILIILAGPLLLAGCPETPMGTVAERDVQTGEIRATIWDRDYDGQADRKADGTPDYVLDPKFYATADTVDSIGMQVLGVAAIFLPAAGWFREAWKRYKGKKLVTNLIASFQVGRSSLKKNGAKGALDILDNALEAVQHPDTRAMVKDIKAAAQMPSVSMAKTPKRGESA